MPQILDCPSCNRKLHVPEDLTGQLVKCPTCGSTFTAGAETAAEPPIYPAAGEAYGAPSPERPVSPREEDEAPRPRKRRRLADDEDDYDDEPARRLDEKPGKVQAIAIMTLIGGILALLTSLSWLGVGIATMGICCLWPGTYYSLVLGIMATMRGSALLGQYAHRLPPPKGIAIMQIINIINGDVPNCVMGIVTLIFLNEPEVRRYFRG